MDALRIGEENKANAKRKAKAIVGDVCLYAALIFFTLCVLIPFYIIFITSIKTRYEAANTDFSWIPKLGISFEGYQMLFKGVATTSIFKGLLNTLWMSVPTVIIGLFFSAVSAFAYAKIPFQGKNLLFSMQLGTMMLPSIITMTSSYLLYDTIGWVNTPLPIIIPGMFGSVGMIFFLRQYFMGVPNELIESARIDGAGLLMSFLTVLLPVAVPALMAQGILNFISHYNEYLAPLLYLTNNPDLYTLQISLRFYVGTYSSDWPTIMAGCVMAILPLVVIYIVLQNKIIDGIQMSSGLKG